MRSPVPVSLLLLLAGVPQAALAATNWGMCAFPVVTRQQDIDYDVVETEIVADRLSTEGREAMLFEGDVRLQRQTQSISADSIKLHRQSEQLQASGNLRYADDLFSLTAQQLELDNQQDRGVFDQVQFQLYENHARGSATRIERLDSDRSDLQDVLYTTCDPGRNDWSLSAGKLQLDQATGLGTAQHAVFRLGGVPLFYFPWVRFPINDQRMSGVLMPTFSHSDIDGDTFALPIYWNQAPNYDMTLTPVWYSERGMQLNTENRFLFDQQSGQLRLSWLEDDLTNDERWYRLWTHEAQSGWGMQTSVLLQKVSDENFLQDFDHLESVSDVDYLRSAVNFSGLVGGWTTNLMFEQHQTINQSLAVSSRPYKRLPQLTLNRVFSVEDGSLQLDWDNELVSFDRDSSITGERLHIAPRFSYALEGDYFFIRPSLQFDFTQYELQNNSNDVNTIDRSIPLVSLDSGLIFERLAGSAGAWTQTLEPRLYFLYVPFEEQGDIPNFDTSLLAQSYNNLFINNRFTGVDRIGDSDQISFGITTRLISLADGYEMLSASLGQAYYAKDRRVSLGSSIDESNKSGLISVINYRPTPAWQIELANVYDQQQKESEQTDISFRRRQQKQVFNLEYHLRQDSLEQSTLSFVYPHSEQLTGFFKYHYSIRQERPVQNLVGLTYESCCWDFTLLYEEKSDTNITETDRAVFFQFTFKGFGQAGNDINSLLEDGILGYQSSY